MPYSDNSIDKKAAPLNSAQQEALIYYRDVIKLRTTGPQLEGLEEDWLINAIKDTSTLTLEIAENKQWPLLVKIEHNIDYREQFFLDHFPDQIAYYLSLPPSEYLGQAEVAEKLTDLVEEVVAQDGIIAYDYQEDSGDEDLILNLLNLGTGYNFVDITPESDAYGRSYGLPNVVHFEAIARQKNKDSQIGDGDIATAFNQLVAEGKYIENPTQGPTLLSKELLTGYPKLLDDIWTMYEAQFSELVDDHPSLQIQPREELEQMLLDDESFNIAFMEDGKVAGLCYFVSNIKKCVWLNNKFFDTLHAKNPDVKMAYFPGIVVDKDKARKGGEYATSMIGLVEQLTIKAGIDIQIVFQCTNISRTYIPQLVTAFIANCDSLELTRPVDSEGNAFQKTAQYNYRVVRPV